MESRDPRDHRESESGPGAARGSLVGAMRRPVLLLVALLACAAPAASAPPLLRGGDWQTLLPSDPLLSPWRSNHTATYDPVRRRMIVVGGRGDDARVWAYTFADPAWRPLATAGTMPGTLRGHSTIYDPLRDRLLVFGGAQDGVVSDHVWSLSLADPPTWSVIEATGDVALRAGHTAIYDPVRDRMVVFGGAAGDAGAWALDLAGAPAWSEIAVVGERPVSREAHVAIYDDDGDRMVMFGGYVNGVLPDTTWSLSLADAPHWTPLATTGEAPPPSWGQSAVYDARRGRMLLFGGGPHPSNVVYRNDRWVLNLATNEWTRWPAGSPAPTARTEQSAVIDPVADELVVFGGRDANAVGSGLADAWSVPLDAGAAWTKRSPVVGVNHPAPRRGAATVFDPNRGRMHVMGGTSTGPFAQFADRWSFALNGVPEWTAWTLSTFPIVPSGAAWDSAGDRLVFPTGSIFCDRLFSDGGYVVPGDAPASTLRFSANGPYPGGREDAQVILDPARGRLILFGGSAETLAGHGSCQFRDTWALATEEFAPWTPIVTDVALSPPAGSRLLLDQLHDRALAFGPDGNVYGLALDGGAAWSVVGVAGAQPMAALFVDRGRDRVVGLAVDGRLFAWALDASGPWQPVPTSGTPAEGVVSGTFDVAGDRVVMFGGTLTDNGVYALSFADGIAAPDAAVVSAAVANGRARIEWHLSGAAAGLAVERRRDDGDWAALASVTADATGRVVFEDAALEPGTRYFYRLAVAEDDGPVYRGETWVQNPALEAAAALSLRGPLANPSAGALRVAFTLAGDAPARLELIDIAGRRRAQFDVGGMGAGEHVVDLGEGATLQPGLYFVRLTQSGRTLTARAIHIR